MLLSSYLPPSPLSLYPLAPSCALWRRWLVGQHMYSIHIHASIGCCSPLQHRPREPLVARHLIRGKLILTYICICISIHIDPAYQLKTEFHSSADTLGVTNVRCSSGRNSLSVYALAFLARDLFLSVQALNTALSWDQINSRPGGGGKKVRENVHRVWYQPLDLCITAVHMVHGHPCQRIEGPFRQSSVTR